MYLIQSQGKNQLFFQGINQTRMHICEIILSCILLAFATASPIPDEIHIAGNYAQVYQSIELFGACKTLYNILCIVLTNILKFLWNRFEKAKDQNNFLQMRHMQHLLKDFCSQNSLGLDDPQVLSFLNSIPHSVPARPTGVAYYQFP